MPKSKKSVMGQELYSDTGEWLGTLVDEKAAAALGVGPEKAGLDDLRSSIADLVGVEPKSIATDRDAAEAATWVDMQKKTEAEAEAILGPAIKEAYEGHRKLTKEKKTLLEKLESANGRVRAGLANWIAAGHAVKGCYVKTKYRVIVDDVAKLPEEYKKTVANMEDLEAWANMTEGKQPVEGCTIEPVNVLYAKEEK